MGKKISELEKMDDFYTASGPGAAAVYFPVYNAKVGNTEKLCIDDMKEWIKSLTTDATAIITTNTALTYANTMNSAAYTYNSSDGFSDIVQQIIGTGNLQQLAVPVAGVSTSNRGAFTWSQHVCLKSCFTALQTIQHGRYKGNTPLYNLNVGAIIADDDIENITYVVQTENTLNCQLFFVWASANPSSSAVALVMRAHSYNGNNYQDEPWPYKGTPKNYVLCKMNI